MYRPHLTSGGRYPVLRSLAILYLFGGAVVGLVALGAAIWSLAAGPGNFMDRTIIAIGALAGGFFLVITALAIAEVLKLFIDLEHNTRMAAHHPTSPVAPSVAGDGVKSGGRLADLEAETAEAALMRGH